MGIRFFCPNGHSLNVRSELAGEIGFCPYCQVRMLIPTESMRQSGERFVEGVSKTAEARPKKGSESLGREGTPRACATVDGQRIDNVNGSRMDLPVAASVDSPVGEIIRQVASAGVAGRGGTSREETNDSSEVVVNDANALWMVSVRGQEYGPATIEIIQSWINQRRIAPKTLVWRQGWKSWKEAQDVFSEMKNFSESQISTSAELRGNNGQRGSGQSEETNEERKERLMRRKKKALTTTVVICSLIALCLVLLVALILILFKQS